MKFSSSDTSTSGDLAYLSPLKTLGFAHIQGNGTINLGTNFGSSLGVQGSRIHGTGFGSSDLISIRLDKRNLWPGPRQLVGRVDRAKIQGLDGAYEVLVVVYMASGPNLEIMARTSVFSKSLTPV